MKKTYVLDTNVILSDPNAIYKFEDNDIVLPTVVIQEIDSKKKLMDEVGRNARHFSRMMDELRENGKLTDGIELRNGGTIKALSHPLTSPAFDSFINNENDNAIIAVAKKLTDDGLNVILVSKDVLVRVKSDTLDVAAEDYLNDKVVTSDSDKYTGYSTHYVESHIINQLFNLKRLDKFKEIDMRENEFLVLKSFDGKQSALVRYNNGYLKPLYSYNEEGSTFGLMAKNVEQRMALDLLLDPNVPLVTLTGKAGTGKTLLTIAAGLQKVAEEQEYTRMIVGRPVVPMGNDIGFLPGEKEDKLRPWMQPIYDNLEYLFSAKNEDELNNILQGYEDMVKVEALTYIRGRSIPNQWIVIDEAQNLTQHEVKTILTRVGENTKVVLVGDPDQIDHPYLDAFSNGLTYAIEKLKDLKESGHVTLHRGERSDLAQICADLL